MQISIHIILALIIGTITSIYLPMNSSVARHLGSLLTANVTFFITAFFTSMAIFLIYGEFNTFSKITDAPIYLYLTGVISAFVVLGSTFLIPQIGARKFFILIITGQIVMAIIVSHFGILESPKDPINIKKILGAFFVILGAVVSTS